MPTSKEIKAYVKENDGFVPDDCWIAHAKMVYRAGNVEFDAAIDIGTAKKPCADHKHLAIFKALRLLGVS